MIEKDAAKIGRMFSDIAPRYDLLNRLLSMGIDRRWRTAAIKKLAPRAGGVYLDVATGTGDVALEIVRQNPNAKVVGVDFAHQMLVMGLPKVKSSSIRMGRGDALNLSFRDDTFDGATCAYGIRNFADLHKGLREINRVLKPGGSIAILEFTTPSNRLMRGLYLFYFKRVLPFIGRAVSGHPEAYTYLPLSVLDFPAEARLKEIFEECGFVDVNVAPLTFGISGLVTGRKPDR